MIQFTTLPFENRDNTHWPVHIIYRLRGSIPQALIYRLKIDYERALAAAKAKDEATVRIYLETEDTSVYAVKAIFQQKYDTLLHQVNSGPHWLQDPLLQEEVIKSWLYLEQQGHVLIHAISVMSNHVHVLLRHPQEEGMTDILWATEQHKRYTGMQGNRHLGRIGQRFWAPGCFDRDVRPGKFRVVLAYVLNNPVKAGLTTTPLDWSGNYLSPAMREFVLYA